MRESGVRFWRLTELASDWYREQNEIGNFTQVSGPVLEMIGIGMPAFIGEASSNEAERSALRESIARRQPFIGFAFSRTHPDGSEQ